jgi:lipopolysaccharide export system permease protein
MKITKSYLTRELVGPFFLGLAIFTFILIIDKVFDLMDLAINKGAGLGTVGLLFTYILPSLLALTVPIAILMATLMAFGRMSADNEITALRASGVSLYHIITPVIVVATLLSFALVISNDTVVPKANFAFKRLYYEIVHKRATVVMAERIWISDFDGFKLYIDRLDDKSGKMHDIILYQLKRGKSPSTILASRGELVSDPRTRSVRLKLEEGTIHEVDSKNLNRYRKLTFGTHYLNLDIHGGLEPGVKVYRGAKEMSIRELGKDIKLSKEVGGHIKSLSVKWHQKISIPFACLAFVLIGAPLGVEMRRGGRSIGFGVSLVLTFLYYLISIGGETMAEKGALLPWAAMWAPNIILGAIGLGLIINVARR